MKSNMSHCISIPKSITKVARISVRDECMPVNGQLLLGTQLKSLTQSLGERVINQRENSQDLFCNIVFCAYSPNPESELLFLCLEGVCCLLTKGQIIDSGST